MAGRSLESLQQRYNRAAAAQKRGFMGGGPRGRGPAGGMGGKPKDTRNTIRRLLRYVTQYGVHLVIVFLCMLCSTVTSLIGAYMLRPVINNAVDLAIPAAERVSNLAQMLLMLLLIYLLGIVSNYTQSRIMLHVSQNATERLRVDLFNRLQKLPIRYFDAQSTGEIMSRFTNDVDSIHMMLSTAVTSLASGTVTLIGTFCFMVTTNI